ncbi:MAG TPA: monovalent cation/H+ antiporter complex subunit F [Acidimicrobiales bacterium]|jgi:multisubunit Na+/H+ antiporter MnhF subunit|nr:monovalent cation/H+ antiporter complex subunit F [Acidimicrobiales bacterium]
MNPWSVAALVVLVAALAPAALLGSRRATMERLVGLELVSVLVEMILTLLSQADGQSSFLIVPLSLAVLSVAGTLVFTRLLAPQR